MTLKNPLTFVTAYLGGTHGTAKSARDFLRALLVNHSAVNVVSPVREEFPRLLCGFTLSKPVWMNMPINAIKLLRKPWKLKAWIEEQIIRYKLKKQGRNSPVIVNGWASYHYWLSVSSYFNSTKVLIIRESPRHFDGPDRKQLLSEMVAAFAKFDNFIFVSDRVRTEWMQNENLKNIKYSILPNCCEEEEAINFLSCDRDMLRTEHGFSHEDFIVFCPGTVEHRKGQDLLLKVVPLLQKSIHRLKVLFVGDVATDWGQNLIRSIPEELLGTQVIHLNAQPGIMGLLRAADVLALPSRAEALPRTILESMAVKTPVVASAVDGVPELILHNHTGLLFECNDHKGLFNGILSLYLDPEKRQQFAKAGSERYWTCFSRVHQFERLNSILKDLAHYKETI